MSEEKQTKSRVKDIRYRLSLQTQRIGYDRPVFKRFSVNHREEVTSPNSPNEKESILTSIYRHQFLEKNESIVKEDVNESFRRMILQHLSNLEQKLEAKIDNRMDQIEKNLTSITREILESNIKLQREMRENFLGIKQQMRNFIKSTEEVLEEKMVNTSQETCLHLEEKIEELGLSIKKQNQQILSLQKEINAMKQEELQYSVPLTPTSSEIIQGNDFQQKMDELLKNAKRTQYKLNEIILGTPLTNKRISCCATWKVHSAPILSMCLTSDESKIVSTARDDTIKIWDISTGVVLRSIRERASSVYISNNDQFLLATCFDHSIKVWNIENADFFKKFDGHKNIVYGVCMSKDDEYVISCSADRTVKVWEFRTGWLKYTFRHENSVRSVCMDNNNEYIISGSSDKSVRIWGLRNGVLVKVLKGHHFPIYSVKISCDNQWITSGSLDETVRLWNLKTGKLVQVIRGATNAFCWMDSDFLITGCLDKTIKIINIKNGTCVKSLNGHSENVTSVLFAKKRNCIISGSDDATIKIWK